MTEIAPDHLQEYKAFLNLTDFARREPSLWAPTNDALAQVIRRIGGIIIPAVECMARFRPNAAEFDWNRADENGNDCDGGEASGAAAYTAWKAHCLLPGNACLAVTASDESVRTSVLVEQPGPVCDARFETAPHREGLYRDIDFSVSEKQVRAASFVKLKPTSLSSHQIILDVLEDEWTAPAVERPRPLLSEAAEIADPGAAEAFESSAVYGLIHYQLWRCARDICGVLEADRMIGEFPPLPAS